MEIGSLALRALASSHHEDSTSCEYGIGNKLTSVTVPWDMNFYQGCGLFWSDAPYSVPAAFLLIFLTTRRISPFILAWVGLSASGVNEIILFRFHREERPDESCLPREGTAFPSGHAALAFSTLWWAVFETIFRPNWTYLRKFLILLIAFIILIPIGPFRVVLKDHTFVQIEAGWVFGIIWGIFNIVLIRFIFARFALEPLYCFTIFRWFFQNDYDPKFRYSHWQGAYFKKHSGTNLKYYYDYHFWEVYRVLFLFYLTIGFANLTFGVWGVIVGPIQKTKDSECDRAAWALSSGSGVFSLILSGFMFVIIYLFYKRFHSRSNPPSVNDQGRYKYSSTYDSEDQNAVHRMLEYVHLDDLAFGAAFFWAMALAWCVAGIQAAYERCDDDLNLILPYFISWVAFNFGSFIFAVVLFNCWSFIQLCRGKSSTTSEIQQDEEEQYLRDEEN